MVRDSQLSLQVYVVIGSYIEVMSHVAESSGLGQMLYYSDKMTRDNDN